MDRIELLTSILRRLPLGILILGENGVVEEAFSESTLELFRSVIGPEIVGASIREILLSGAFKEMPRREKLSIIGLTEIIGQDLEAFQRLAANFPGQIYLPLPLTWEKGKHLRTEFIPLVVKEKLFKVIVTFEDVTQQVFIRQLEERHRELENEMVARILELKRVDPELLEVFMSEIGGLFSELRKFLAEKNHDRLFGVLHTMKGSSRTAGLKRFTTIIHHLETTLANMVSAGRLDWTRMALGLREIRQEWNLLDGLYEKILKKVQLFRERRSPTQGRYLGPERRLKGSVVASPLNRAPAEKGKLFEEYRQQLRLGRKGPAVERILLAMKASRYLPLAKLEKTLLARAQETAGTLKKEVELRFEWNDTRADDRSQRIFNTCFFHLINNALDHGIGGPEEREQIGKSPRGLILIKAWEDNGVLFGSVEDDGRGPSVEKVRQKVIEKGLLTSEEAHALDEEQVLSFIFHYGISTREEVTEISGRGVGLDAVSEMLRDAHGNIEMQRGRQGGTLFTFHLLGEERTKIERRYRSMNQFVSQLLGGMEELVRQGINVRVPSLAASSPLRLGIAHCDLDRLVLALTTQIGALGLAGGSSPAIRVKLLKTKAQLHCIFTGPVIKDSSEAMDKHPEFPMALPYCEDLIRQHGGSIRQRAGGVVLSLEMIVPEGQIPVINVGCLFSPQMHREGMDNFLRELREVGTRLSLHIQFHGMKKEGMHLYVTEGERFKADLPVAPSGRNWLHLGQDQEALTRVLLDLISLLMSMEREISPAA